MFDGFQRKRLPGAGAEINLRVGGEGPPLLLVHGYPQTHAMWHIAAPRLAEHFTVVTPDLRGYGDSAKPPSDSEHAAYSKRAMAKDLVEAMRALGFEQFGVAGHDRGGRVAYRMALDHPDRVRKLATLDIVPTLEQFERMGMSGSMGSFHWYFLAQPAPFPERMIGADPEYFMRHLMNAWAASPDAFVPEAMAEYARCFRDPDTIRATCEDYRAGATIDCALDRADREVGRKIACPMLALWGNRGRPHKRKQVMEIWRDWTAGDLQGKGVDCGHFLPEEAPDETCAALLDFFRG